MLVSVIIPHFNDSIRLAICLEALNKQKLPPETNLQIIVADNGSDTAPFDICKGIENTELVIETTPGSYAARNTALKHARGEIIAFTDSDCIPDKNWLSNAIEYLERHQDIDLIGGAVCVNPQTQRPNLYELYDQLFGFPQEWYVNSKSFAVTANLIVRKHVFDHTGVFATKLLSGGDQEWCKRATNNRHKLAYVANCRVNHPARSNWKQVSGKIKRTCGGKYASANHWSVKTALVFIWPKIPLKRQVLPLIKNSSLSIFCRLKVLLLIAALSLTQSVHALKLLTGISAPKRE